jgi:hypothetical protein
MKKMDTQIHKDKLYQGTQQSPQEHPERSNQWEFHRDVTRHGQPKYTGGTQEIPAQKNKEYEKTQKQINEIIGALNKHQTKQRTP